MVKLSLFPFFLDPKLFMATSFYCFIVKVFDTSSLFSCSKLINNFKTDYLDLPYYSVLYKMITHEAFVFYALSILFYSGSDGFSKRFVSLKGHVNICSEEIIISQVSL